MNFLFLALFVSHAEEGFLYELRKFFSTFSDLLFRDFCDFNGNNCVISGCCLQNCGISLYIYILDFPGGSDIKVSTYNVADLGLIPGLGRSPGEGNGRKWQPTSVIFAWKIPWMEEPGRLQSMGSQRVGLN